MKTAIIIIITVFTTLFCVFSATADYCDLTQEEYEKRMEKIFLVVWNWVMHKESRKQ